MADPNDDEWLYGAEGDGEGSRGDEMDQGGAETEEIEAKNGTAEIDGFDDHHHLEVIKCNS